MPVRFPVIHVPMTSVLCEPPGLGSILRPTLRISVRTSPSPSKLSPLNLSGRSLDGQAYPVATLGL